MQLRPYQQEAHDSIFNEWNKGVQKTLLVLPTGCGKTIVFAEVAKDCVKDGDRVLIMAHRGELLEQASDKIAKSTGLGCAMEKASETCIGSWFRIVVGSVQTLQRPKRMEQFPRNYFDKIIIDEAHHCLSDGYQRVLEYFNTAKVLGVTATPDRGDMRNLGSYFESLAYQYTLPKAIKEGFLAPIKALTLPLKMDLSGVGVQAGDFKVSDIGTALDPYLHQITEEMKKYCMDRKTVVFLPLVKTSQKFRDILNENGFRAAEVNGDSKDRSEILKHTERHELCHPANLICEDEEVAKTMTKNLEDKANACLPEDVLEAIDIEDAEEQASNDVVAQREESLAKLLSEMKKRKRKLVDPLQFEMSIMDQDLSGYKPLFGWEMAPASDKQIKALEKFGIFPDEIDNAGKANLLLDRLDKRRQEGLTTPKQIRFLESRGFQHVGTWSFDAASSLINRIAASGWKIPKGIDPKTYKGE